MNARDLMKKSFNKKLKKFFEDYMKVYDHCSSKEQKCDDLCLKNLANTLSGIFEIFEAYSDGFLIYPGYALEKLKNSKRYFEDTIDYFENKLEEEGK